VFRDHALHGSVDAGEPRWVGNRVVKQEWKQSDGEKVAMWLGCRSLTLAVVSRSLHGV
jgi:hypothetical protein